MVKTKSAIDNPPNQIPIPHGRTFRKAREQVKSMVTYGFATQSIKNYLLRWCNWWAKTVKSWSVELLLEWFIEDAHQDYLKVFIQIILDDIYATRSHSCRQVVALGLSQAAV